ncbi:hypothetical protein U9K52_12185 [Chryseobacterium sp. MHB01]|uniref:hypothetical protein n=1 Tax=Chryseobacterium sp. MHB01 TaxID=3109433 RepID=UPI002AFE920A|nr:hypothetical protein [Chryseobacterium sp. MHB01]MEA1849674.1 hypothetical protein [Chryseobacterium sp. MHB01]
MKIQYFKFHTDYHQFYLEDKSDDNKGNPTSPDFWNEESFKSRLAMVNGIVGIGIESYGNNIKGEIEILDKPNINVDFNKYDHIVEGGIYISSGELQVINCPDNNLELSLKIDPGKYRVRIYSSNLDSVKYYDVPNDTDNDYYRIELWKSDDMERKVLKQYEE